MTITPSHFRKSVLPSGITLLSEAVPDRASVSVGVWVRNGARDEPAELLGVSHFIEHMMFKGTERRDARAIASSLESLGGQMDAFTAREQVCFYARVLSEHLPQAVDVLSDIVCHSRFAEPEVSRERSVVREEILACEDNPEDKVGELLAAQMWDGHALGRPILGTLETIGGMGSETLLDYFRSRYRPEHLVIAAAGGLDHGRLEALVGERFAPPAGEVRPLSPAPPAFRPMVLHEARGDLQQLYLSLGTRSLPYAHPDHFGLIVLNILLGGGMSSRLFQSVREEAGLAYTIFSSVDFYRDSGAVTIHLGVSPDRARETLARLREELQRLCEDGPAADEVSAARAQLRGSVLMGFESVSSRMFQLSHDELYCGRYSSADEQIAEIDAVNIEQVTRLARQYLQPSRFVLTALGPAPDRPITEDDWPVADAVHAAA